MNTINSIKKGPRIISWSLLAILYVSFTFNILFKIIGSDLNIIIDQNSTYILKRAFSSLIPFCINIFIMLLVSSNNPLEYTSMKYKKIIKGLIYIITTFIFIIWSLFVGIDATFYFDILITYKKARLLFLEVITLSIFASISVNLIQYSISRKIK